MHSSLSKFILTSDIPKPRLLRITTAPNIRFLIDTRKTYLVSRQKRRNTKIQGRIYDAIFLPMAKAPVCLVLSREATRIGGI